MAEINPLLAGVAVIVLLGVAASKVSTRLGVPALLLFLGLGMLAGSEGIGGIDFTDAELAQGIGIVALAFILFSGGFHTDGDDVRPVAARGVLLSTVGVLVTALISGAVAATVLGVSLTVGILLGSIMSSTDAAAVFTVLRSREVGLRRPLRPLLELESASNDPMAVFLALGCLTLLTDPDASVASLVPAFLLQMAVGGLVGVGTARVGVWAVNRTRLEYEGLYPVVMIAVVLLVYGLAAVLGGSGFLAVYVAGLTMGRARMLHKRSLMRFVDGLAWLMQIAMFVVLGLLVVPSDVAAVAGRAIFISLVLVLVARPVATAAVLALTRFPVRETALVSWVGLRGAAPIILATFPLVDGIEQADLIFNVVFFVVVTSVLLQGTTVALVARWLGVDAPLDRRGPQILDVVEAGDGSTGLHELTVPPRSAVADRQIVDLGLPAGALVVLISRDDEFVVPQGSTVLLAGDDLLVLADDEALPVVEALVHSEGRRPPP